MKHISELFVTSGRTHEGLDQTYRRRRRKFEKIVQEKMTILTNTANKIEFSAKFVPKSSYFSTESAKFGAFKKRLRKKLKIFKLIVEILKA